jgi:arylformamidase
MQVSFEHQGKKYSADFSQPIDISIPLRAGAENVKAFYAGDVKIEPMKAGNFIGDVLQGGSCNVNDISFNPHCNGTHTECVGHISKEKHSLNQCLKEFFFMAQLITVTPEEINGDKIITKNNLRSCLSTNSELQTPNSLILRTLPNDSSKLTRDYSGKNAPYIHHEAATWMREQGIEHLLLDLPSVDKEDDSKLLAHHAYWHYPENTREHATITELIYVPDSIPDGIYLLNLQVASFENDASPSKPVLYQNPSPIPNS